MEVRGIDLPAHAERRLAGEEVAEGTAHRLLHRPADAAGRFQFSCPRREADLYPVRADGAVGADGRGVDRPGWQWVGRDEIAPTLLGHANEVLLAGLADHVAEGGLIVLEGAHLLELLLHSSPAFQRQ